jgi:hypothetical protein
MNGNGVATNGKHQVVTAWAPLIGRWNFESQAARYVGPQTDQVAMRPFGICVSNVRFSEGEALASIHLPGAATRISEDASAYLVFGYRSLSDEYLAVGLAGYRSAYTVSRFDPTVGWRAVAAAGSKENLTPERLYRVRVRVRGQSVMLEVDGIRVLDHVLETPLPNGQLGLFAWGNEPIEFTDVSVSEEPGKVFVVMQFSEPYQELYQDVIQPVTRDFGLEAHHAGEVFGPGIILDDIVHDINEAKIVVAEITEQNQNVFYELGYAHALRKPTILLAEKNKDLPFDVSGYRCLFYENSIGGKRKVEEGLRKHLQAILHE